MAKDSENPPVGAPLADNYRMKYRVQGCFDDGGWGHDVYWSDATREFTAKDDAAAKRAAKKYITEHSGKCGCSSCDNNGLQVLVSVEHVVAEQVRAVV